MTFKLNIPLFAVAHRRIGGTESAIYNLVRSIQQTGRVALGLPHGPRERLSGEFLQWLDQHDYAAPSPGYAQKLPQARFLQEWLYEQRRNKGEAVLYPNYFLPLPSIHRRAPFTVLLHDIQYKSLPQFHSRKRIAWLDFYLPRMFAAADMVFVISDFERQQVARHFGDAAGAKCRVVYNAIDFDRYDGERSTLPDELLGRSYLLSVFHPFPHKNSKVLLDAFSILADRRPDLELYLVGASPETTRTLVEAVLPAVIGARVKLLGFVSDADLGALYRHAKAYVLPSIYEGFGMPAVEAMGLGIPAIVSDRTAIPEVTRGKAHYVSEVDRPASWADTIDTAIAGSAPGDRAAIAREMREIYSPTRVGNAVVDALEGLGAR